MKDTTKIVITSLVTLITLTALGAAIAANSIVIPADEAEAINAQRYSGYFDVPFREFPHGEDYEIRWEDEGLEAYVRFLLKKPEGAIRHSDVWDVQAFAIDLRFPQNRHCIWLTELPEGWESFYEEKIDCDPNVRRFFAGVQFPTVVTLNDLQHFDSLQIFLLKEASGIETPLDISATKEMESLQILKTVNRNISEEP